MKKQLIILALVLFSFSCSSFAKPKAVAYLMPEGFTGGVVIAYDQPNGITPEVANDGTILYRIPKDGFLKVKQSFEGSDFRYNFYYVDDKDNLAPIEYILPKGAFAPPNTNLRSEDAITEDERNNKIFAMNFNIAKFILNEEDVQLYVFSVGHPKDASFLYDKTLDKINETKNKLSTKSADTVKIAYLIPEEYVGGVIICYDSDGVKPDEAHDDAVFYRIPDNGFIKIKPLPNYSSFQMNFYYVDDKDKLTPIEPLFPKTDKGDPRGKNANIRRIDSVTEDEQNNGIFIMDYRTVVTKSALLYAFSVGHPKDSASIHKKTTSKAIEIGEQLSKKQP